MGKSVNNWLKQAAKDTEIWTITAIEDAEKWTEKAAKNVETELKYAAKDTKDFLVLNATGELHGDNENNTIHAITFGGNIYAYGGDDTINLGAIAANVYTGEGDDIVNGGAAYLKIIDEQGDLYVNGAAGYIDIQKKQSGHLSFYGATGAANIHHQGNHGNIRFQSFAIGNRIHRQGGSGDIFFSGAGGYSEIISQVVTGNINFNGAGGYNKITRRGKIGHIFFNGIGAANVIYHHVEQGSINFNGSGGANIIVKTGQRGNFCFIGAGIANVLIHNSQHGNMHVNAAGGLNVLIRQGKGDYKASLLAAGNISIQRGDGNSYVNLAGGFNTHTQIGNTRNNAYSSWIAIGGLNILTQIGKGNLISFLGGIGNVFNKIGDGHLKVAALGAANIIIHITDEEKSYNTCVITLGGTNILAKKGRGDIKAIMAGGLNVINQVGHGMTIAIMLGGGNILTKVGNGTTIGILFGLGNIMTQVGDGSMIGVVGGAGNILIKIWQVCGAGAVVGVMLGIGNIFAHIGTGNTDALMAAKGNIFTKIGNGDVLALTVGLGNILTQIGSGLTVALMLAKGNLFTKVGDGTSLVAMLGGANIMAHIGHGDTFALMLGKGNIFIKVGTGLTAALMIGSANVYSHIVNSDGDITAASSIALVSGNLNTMIKVGSGLTLAVMLGKANTMIHFGEGITGALMLGKGNVAIKIGNGFMGIVALSEANILTHVGDGTTAAVLYGRGNVLIKVGDGFTGALMLAKQGGNVMAHIGHGTSLAVAVGIPGGKTGNIIAKVGDGLGVNLVWGDLNLMIHIGQGDRYNFAKGDVNVIARVNAVTAAGVESPSAREVSIVQGRANSVTRVGAGDNYTGAWGDINAITHVGDGRNVVLAKGRGNILVQVGNGGSYQGLWGEANINNKVGNGTRVTVAKGRANVTTTVGDGLNVAVSHGDLNANTKVGDGNSINITYGQHNVNTQVGDGLNVAVMKGQSNINIHVGDGLGIAASYGRNNLSIKIGNGDYYGLTIASSNTESHKLATLFTMIKQNILGRVGSQAINYLVQGNEGQSSGSVKGRGEIKLTQPEYLDGFSLSADQKNNLQFAATKAETTGSLLQEGGIVADDEPDLSQMQSLPAGHRGMQSSDPHFFSAVANNTENKTRIEAKKQRLQQEKAAQLAVINSIQTQLENTDQATLATNGEQQRVKIAAVAESVVGELTQIAEGLDFADTARYQGNSGQQWRANFAEGIVDEVNQRLRVTKTQITERIQQAKTDIHLHRARIKKEGLAHAEGAVKKGRTAVTEAEQQAATQRSKAGQRETEARSQQEKGQQAANKAQEASLQAQSRGEQARAAAQQKIAQANTKATSVQQTPQNEGVKNRQADSQGSGLQGRAYISDAPEMTIDQFEIESADPQIDTTGSADGSFSNGMNALTTAEQQALQNGLTAVNQLQINAARRGYSVRLPVAANMSSTQGETSSIPASEERQPLGGKIFSARHTRKPLTQMSIEDSERAHSAGLWGRAIDPRVAMDYADTIFFDGQGRIRGLKTLLSTSRLSTLEQAMITPLTESNSLSLREAPKTETESLIEFSAKLKQIDSPTTHLLFEQAKRLWLDGQVNSSKMQDFFNKATAQLTEYPRLQALAQELFLQAKQEKQATQHHDNIFGRRFDSEFVSALMTTPSENALQTSRTFGRYLVSCFDNRINMLFPPGEDDALRAEQIQRTIEKFAGAVQSDTRHWFNQVPSIVEFIAQPNYDTFKTMMTDVSHGYDVIKIPYFAMKMLAMHRMGLASPRESWQIRANEAYKLLHAQRNTNPNIAYQNNKDDYEVITDTKRTTQDYGILLPHHPPNVREGFFAEGRDITASRLPQYNQLSAFEKTALQQGMPIVTGLSGNTNFLTYAYKNLAETNPTFSVNQAFLNTLMFVVFDGGHSVNESLSVYQAITKTGALNENFIRFHSIRYSDLAALFSDTDRTLISHALETAFTNTLRFYQQYAYSAQRTPRLMSQTAIPDKSTDIVNHADIPRIQAKALSENVFSHKSVFASVMKSIAYQYFDSFAGNKENKKLSFHFNQGFNLLDKLAKLIPEYAPLAITEGNKEQGKNFLKGICFALSARYMTEERIHGQGGGQLYIQRLKQIVESYQSSLKQPKQADGLADIQKILQTNYRQSLVKVSLDDLLKIQYSQILIEEYDPANDVSRHEMMIDADKLYGDVLQKNGLTVEKELYATWSQTDNYESVMASLRKDNIDKNIYMSFMSQDHAMSVVVRKDGEHCTWSFFDPNFGGKTFTEYQDFKHFMDKFHTRWLVKYEFIPGGSRKNFAINFNTFQETEIQEYDGRLRRTMDAELDHILGKLKTLNVSFKLPKNMQGQITDYQLSTDKNGQSVIGSLSVKLTDSLTAKTVTADFSHVPNDLTYFNTFLISRMASIMNGEVRGVLRVSPPDQTVNSAPDTVDRQPLSHIELDRPKNTPLAEWVMPPVVPLRGDGGDTQYDAQLIIQTEDDPAVSRAAAELAAKHAHSVIIQLAANGEYRVVQGDENQLKGKNNLRWQVVGHGRNPDAQTNNSTLAGQTPIVLADNLKQLRDKLGRKLNTEINPNRLALVGCSLKSFAEQFTRALNLPGVKIKAYTKDMIVTPAGRKRTLDDTGQLHSKRMNKRAVWLLNQQGEVEYSQEQTRNHVVESDIDIRLVGVRDTEKPPPRAMTEQNEVFTRTRQAPVSSSVVNQNNNVSYTGNIDIVIGDGEFLKGYWGTSNLALKIGNGGFKTLMFGDNNVAVHLGSGNIPTALEVAARRPGRPTDERRQLPDEANTRNQQRGGFKGEGYSNLSVDLGGYQAFEGVQAFIGQRNVSFNQGRSNDLIIMFEKGIPSPPLVNPFDGAARIADVLQNMAHQGNAENWQLAQDQQWTLLGAKRFVKTMSGLDQTSAVDYDTLTDLNAQTQRNSRALKSQTEAALNKKYQQWLSGNGQTTNGMSRVDKFRQANDKAVFNLAVGGRGADIIGTASNWNFTFGDNIQSIMDTNLGSLFSLMTQQYSTAGLAPTTFTFRAADLPRQLKNKFLHKLAGVSSDTTLADLFEVDYTNSGEMISRTGASIDAVSILKEMMEVMTEFGGEQLRTLIATLTDPQKLQNLLKSSINMSQDTLSSFLKTHGLQESPSPEPDTLVVPNTANTPVSPPVERPFGLNAVNIPNLLATLFHPDKRTELKSLATELKDNLTKDLLNMQQKTFDFLRSSGHLQGDGDLNFSLGNYNFTWGGDGKDLGAYLGDNNNFWGGRGDDVFYAMGLSNLFTGGEGDDIGVLMGRENTMFGGRGNDTAVVAGLINTVSLGLGNDNAFVFGSGGNIETGLGNDYAVISGNYNQLHSGGDQDFVVIIGNNNNAQLGADDDSARIFGNENNISGNDGRDKIKLMGYSCVINGDQGDDYLMAQAISKYSQLHGGAGNDLMVLGGYQNTFSGGEGIDNFVVSRDIIENTVLDIHHEDFILLKISDWKDLWFQRKDNDLIISINRKTGMDSEQAKFESIGAVSFTDYFDGKRAKLVVDYDQESASLLCNYTALSDHAVDGLVNEMSAFSPSVTESAGLMGEVDRLTQTTFLTFWKQVSRGAGNLRS